MPAYDGVRWIAAALSSVLDQTLRDLEVIVVDDGSRDRTAAIVADIAAADARVRLLRRPNGGVSSARNVALAASAGEFLALLDCDDLWDPPFLEEQIAIFRARPDVDIVTGNARDLGGWRDGQPSCPYPDARSEPNLSAILADERAVFIMSVFKRTVSDRIGGFDEALRTNEDYDYWLRAALAGFRFARNHRPLAQYRRSEGSLSASDVTMLRGILRVFQKVRPSLLDSPRDLALLDRQVDHFTTELMAAEARTALESGEYQLAAARLAALHRRRPGLEIAFARALASCAPRLLAKLYRARRARLEARHARPPIAA
jgi:glycosyltransferase involved in cell wall biosynthesis